MGDKILLIGGGGHCNSVLDSLLSIGSYSEIGIVDSHRSNKQGVSIVGNDNDLPTLKENGWSDAFVTVGSIGDTILRRRLFDMISDLGFNIPAIIDPTAAVSGDAKIEEGVYVGKNAIINSGAKIGKGSIINSGGIVEHDCSIGEFVHISPGATLCGQVKIGNDSHIGAGSVTKQQIIIGTKCMIGAGSVVIRDIPDDSKAYGNPCKVVKE